MKKSWVFRTSASVSTTKSLSSGESGATPAARLAVTKKMRSHSAILRRRDITGPCSTSLIIRQECSLSPVAQAFRPEDFLRFDPTSLGGGSFAMQEKPSPLKG